ncbi:MAG: hypothetical protein IPO21_13895 [Bacteroidales bacterium]|nr:hypothetical protein [Bacteroidales bacterium]
MKKNIIKLATLLFVVLITNSCSISTKDEYLKEFESFVETTNEKALDYSESKWSSLDESYKEYSKEYYKKFKSELSKAEKLKIKQIQIKYNSAKAKAAAKNGFKNLKKAIEDTSDKVDDAIDDIVD